MTIDLVRIRDAAPAARKLTANDCGLVQCEMMSQERFAKFAAERLGGSFNQKDVVGLWRLGLLRADLVTSPRLDPHRCRVFVNIEDGHVFQTPRLGRLVAAAAARVLDECCCNLLAECRAAT